MVRPLSLPLEVKVAASEDGDPVTIALKGNIRQVSQIRNSWRLDEEWWRSEISRRYFEVELTDGLVMTVFHDLVLDKWYQQKF
jgi:hypothetical protein